MQLLIIGCEIKPAVCLFYLPPLGKPEGCTSIVSCAGVVYDYLRLLSRVQADNGDFILVVAGERGPCEDGIPGEMEFVSIGMVLSVYLRRELQHAPGNVYLAVVKPEIGVFAFYCF